MKEKHVSHCKITTDIDFFHYSLKWLNWFEYVCTVGVVVSSINNFSCYMLSISIFIYTVYPSIISQGLFFCTKSGRSFKGQRLFEEQNIPSLPSAPWSDGWTQNIKFSFTSLAISLFSKMGLKDQNLDIEAHCTYFIHSLSSDSGCDLLNLFT